MIDDQGYYHDPHALDAAKGMLIGLAAGIALWVVIALVLWAALA